MKLNKKEKRFLAQWSAAQAPIKESVQKLNEYNESLVALKDGLESGLAIIDSLQNLIDKVEVLNSSAQAQLEAQKDE